LDREHPAVPGGKVPHLDRRRLDDYISERGADLAAVIGPVVERLGQPDPEGRVCLVAVVFVFDDVRVGVEIAGDEALPDRIVSLHHGT
jgi:hypothetical protein